MAFIVQTLTESLSNSVSLVELTTGKLGPKSEVQLLCVEDLTAHLPWLTPLLFRALCLFLCFPSVPISSRCLFRSLLSWVLYSHKASYVLSGVRWTLVSRSLRSVLLPVALASAGRVLGKAPQQN